MYAKSVTGLPAHTGVCVCVCRISKHRLLFQSHKRRIFIFVTVKASHTHDMALQFCVYRHHLMLNIYMESTLWMLRVSLNQTFLIQTHNVPETKLPNRMLTKQNNNITKCENGRKHAVVWHSPCSITILF